MKFEMILKVFNLCTFILILYNKYLSLPPPKISELTTQKNSKQICQYISNDRFYIIGIWTHGPFIIVVFIFKT